MNINRKKDKFIQGISFSFDPFTVYYQKNVYYCYNGVRLIYLQKCNFPQIYCFKLLATQCAWAKYFSQIWRAETFSIKRVHLKTMPDMDINLLQPSYRRSKKLTIFCVAIPLFMSNTLMYLQIAIDTKKAFQNIFSYI